MAAAIDTTFYILGAAAMLAAANAFARPGDGKVLAVVALLWPFVAAWILISMLAQAARELRRSCRSV